MYWKSSGSVRQSLNNNNNNNNKRGDKSFAMPTSLPYQQLPQDLLCSRRRRGTWYFQPVSLYSYKLLTRPDLQTLTSTRSQCSYGTQSNNWQWDRCCQRRWGRYCSPPPWPTMFSTRGWFFKGKKKTMGHKNHHWMNSDKSKANVSYEGPKLNNRQQLFTWA